MPEPFWSDTFDMDLPKVIPGLDQALGGLADTRLWTYGRTSHGRLNHASVWGIDAYFGLDPFRLWKPDSYTTSNGIVACTWREALRDAWPHTYRVNVDGHPLWDAHKLGQCFQLLMYDLRGQKPLPYGKADKLRGRVLATVIAATRDLQQLIAAHQGVTVDAG